MCILVHSCIVEFVGSSAQVATSKALVFDFESIFAAKRTK